MKIELNRESGMSDGGGLALTLVLVVVIIGVLIGLAFAVPVYRVWQLEKSGQAQLAEAEWNRRIRIQEAAADMESAKHLAQAEIERAKGVAEANRIIGESLQDNEVYIRYLWVQGLNDGNSEVIYIPTEANLPILEASRLSK